MSRFLMRGVLINRWAIRLALRCACSDTSPDLGFDLGSAIRFIDTTLDDQHSVHSAISRSDQVPVHQPPADEPRYDRLHLPDRIQLP